MLATGLAPLEDMLLRVSGMPYDLPKSPIPEDEQRRLQEIERALYEDDPDFARLMRAGNPRVRYGRKLMQVLLG